MRHLNILLNTCYFGIALLFAGCNTEEVTQEPDPNLMVFDVLHPAQTRATATGFENSDRIGLFITEVANPLQVSGNYVNNALLTFNGTTWQSSSPVWYDNGTYNAYAYYPYTTIVSSVNDYPFEISPDQSTSSTGGTLGGYEASDFLWASQMGITASASPVFLKFSHRMSRVLIRLIKGEDYEGDISSDAMVYVHNTVTSVTIDLSVGVATVNPHGTAHTIKARNEGNSCYSAIVVPQRLANRRPLVEVVMKGVSYMMESNFVFKPGVQHTVSLIISRNPEQVKIEIGGEVENWD